MLSKLFEPIEHFWPTFCFLSLGFTYGWLDVQTSSLMVFTNKSSSEFVNLDGYLFLLTLFIAVFVLLGFVFHKVADVSFSLFPVAIFAACSLAASMLLGILLNNGYIPSWWLFISAILSGFGAAWFLLACANAYSSFEPKKIFIYAGLSKVVGIIVYFIVVGLPAMLSAIVMMIIPFVSALLVQRLNTCGRNASEEKNKDEKKSLIASPFFQEQSKSFISNSNKRNISKLALVCFVLFFIAAFAKLMPISGSGIDDVTTTYLVLDFCTLFLCLIYVLIVIVAPYPRKSVLSKLFYLGVAIILVLFIVSPLLTNKTPALSWVCGSVRNLLDAVVFAVSALIIRNQKTSAALVYGLIGGLQSMGGFCGHALDYLAPLGVSLQSPFIVLGIDFAAAILLFVIFTPKDFAVLLSSSSDTTCSPTSLDVRHETILPYSIDVFGNRYGFSLRETEVFSLLLQGYTIRLIAKELSVSQSTIKTHISKIYIKSNVKSRDALLLKYKEMEIN